MTISEIKTAANTKLKGTHLKCFFACLLYFLISLALTYISKSFNLNSYISNIIIIIIQLLLWIISIPLGYGIVSNIIKLSDSETKSVTKFIDDTILNFFKIIKLFLFKLFRLAIPLILFILSTFYLIGTASAFVNSKNFLCFFKELLPIAILLFILASINLIYFALNYALTNYLYYNLKEKNNLKQVLNKSKELMKSHKFDFIKLILSFIPYLLFVGILLFIFGKFIPDEYLTSISIIFYAFIKPYITISKLLFTEELGNN